MNSHPLRLTSACVLFALSIAVSAAAQVPEAPPPAPLSFAWRVEQGFRLWDAVAVKPADADAQERLLAVLATSNDPDIVHDQIVAFLKPRPWLHRQAHWDPETRRYDLSYLYPRNYAVRIGLKDPISVTGRTCRWSTSIGVIDRSEVGCDYSVRLTLPARANNRAGSEAATVTVTLVDPANPRTVSEQVHVKDRLIVSLGDSFASGEGNPDVPANLAVLSGGPGVGWTADWSQRWMGREAMQGVRNPSWADLACHRSLYNQHMVAALKYAASRPHEAVTFISYACSGAAVFEGLLVEQPRPPGYRDDSNLPEQDVSQVESLFANLCPPDEAGASSAVRDGKRTYKKRVLDGWFGNTEDVSTPNFRCSAGPGRTVDAILMSVGGNDIGFSPVIQGVLLPEKAGDAIGQVALLGVRKMLTLSAIEANERIQKTLPLGLKSLATRVREVAGPAPVIQALYPSPVRGDDGRMCGPRDEREAGARSHPSLRRLIATSGMWPDQNLSAELRWGMSIDQREGINVEPVVVTALNNAVEFAAEGARWAVVRDFQPRFATHGWCAGDPTAEQATLPDWNPAAQSWSGWDPSRWDPYVRRARLFRTPNDAALTQAQEQARPIPIAGLLVTQRQLALMNSLAGSFHPTFQAHVMMGLSVANQLNAELPPDR